MSSDVLGHDPFSEKRARKSARRRENGARARREKEGPLGTALEEPRGRVEEPDDVAREGGNGPVGHGNEAASVLVDSDIGGIAGARMSSERRARTDMEEILREALASLREELGSEIPEGELRDALARAVREATAEEPKGSTPIDMMGDLVTRLVRSLPLEQVRLSADALDPPRVIQAMRAGLDVAHALLDPLHPTHLAEVDEFGFDEGFTDRFLPLFEFMFSTYWRCDLHGIEHVPNKGRALLVANHSGVVPWDATMLFTGVRRHHPNKRHLRCLMLDLFATLPFVGTLFTRLGQIRACPENGRQLLERDHLVGVFPEGLKGIGKLYTDRYRLQRFGRGGYVRLAIASRAPIIPTAIVGGEEIYPLFYRADWLARLFNFPYFPVTLSFPWLGLLGLIPLPSKWVIVVGEPIDLSDYSASDAEDDLLVNDLSDRIKIQIRDMLYAGLKNRRSVFVG